MTRRRMRNGRMHSMITVATACAAAAFVLIVAYTIGTARPSATTAGTSATATATTDPVNQAESEGRAAPTAPALSAATVKPTLNAKPGATPAPPKTTPAPAKEHPQTTKPRETTGTGAAPSGQAFAGPGNTGPASAGFNPTKKYVGPYTITKRGTVIRNQIISAGLLVTADDVTIQGNIIEGATDLGSDQAALRVDGDGAKILNNVIRGRSTTNWRSDPVNGVKLLGAGIVFSGNDVNRIAGDGISLYGENVTVTGNWVHDFVFRDGDVHYDGLHYPTPGNDKYQKALIQNNRVELWVHETSTSGMTTALGLPEVHSAKILVNHNLLAGGGYSIEGGGPGTTITNNLFWTKFSPKVGVYGIAAHIGERGAVIWSGNGITHNGSTMFASVSSY